MLDTTEIVVVAGGLAAIVFVLWFFFGARQAAAATADESGIQRIRVTVQGGFAPDVVTVKQGRPVRLEFFRNETSACSEQVVFGDFEIVRDLPAFSTTTVEFTPDRAGRFTWTCGMRMLRGTLVVEPDN
ncbi:MAG: cupredoxin domain-containing protein [Acidobacteria bacterium]|nr:cupredoxin domain-containing protein [Acidobacteriota bacterium]